MTGPMHSPTCSSACSGGLIHQGSFLAPVQLLADPPGILLSGALPQFHPEPLPSADMDSASVFEGSVLGRLLVSLGHSFSKQGLSHGQHVYGQHWVYICPAKG